MRGGIGCGIVVNIIISNTIFVDFTFNSVGRPYRAHMTFGAILSDGRCPSLMENAPTGHSCGYRFWILNAIVATAV